MKGCANDRLAVVPAMAVAALVPSIVLLTARTHSSAALSAAFVGAAVGVILGAVALAVVVAMRRR